MDNVTNKPDDSLLQDWLRLEESESKSEEIEFVELGGGEPLIENHIVRNNPPVDSVQRNNIQIPANDGVPKNEKLVNKFVDLKQEIDKKLNGPRLKPNESVALKVFGVALRNFVSGVSNIFIGAGLLFHPVGWALQIRQGTLLPTGMHVMYQGGKKIWGCYEEGQKICNAERLSKEQLQTFEQRQATLDKVLSGNPALKDNQQFNDFLKDNWPNDSKILSNEPGYDAGYDLDRLGEFITLYEKQVALDTGKQAIKETRREQVLDFVGSNIEEVTRQEIDQWKLAKAQEKFESYFKKRSNLLEDLGKAGVDISNPPRTIEDSIDDVIKEKKEEKIKLQERSEANKINLENNAKALNKQNQFIAECKEKINKLENPLFKETRDKIEEWQDPENLTVTREDRIGDLKDQLGRYEKQKKVIETEQEILKDKKTKLKKDIDENDKLIPKYEAFKKNEASKTAIDKTIVKLSKLPVEDNTARGKTKALEAENKRLEQELASETRENLKGLIRSEIQQNKDEIKKLEPVVKKENLVRLMINPNAEKIDKLEKEIANDSKRIIDAIDAINPDHIEDVNTLKTQVKEQIATLKREAQDFFNEDVGSREGGLKMQSANELQDHLNTIEKLQPLIEQNRKEIKKLYENLPLTQDDIDAEMHALQNRISNGQVQSNAVQPDTTDLRKGSLDLKKWQDKGDIKENTATVKYDPNKTDGNIYLFGTYTDRPTHGTYVPLNDKYPGQYLNLNKSKLQALGRTNANNFLSNEYPGQLNIDGKPYKSVTHYLYSKKIEKAREEANSKVPVNRQQLRYLEHLEELINKADDPHFFYEWYNEQYDVFPADKGAFNGMDGELKKALYYKFVGPDGKPNEEGRMLLATGNVKLYAGQEASADADVKPGTPVKIPAYGMRIDKQGEMVGGNKLGNALEELRETLRKQEKRASERDWLNLPEEERVRQGPEIRLEDVRRERREDYDDVW